MVGVQVLLGLSAGAWAQDARAEEWQEEVDPEALLLETELAIGEFQDGDAPDAVELGILENQVEGASPMLPWAGPIDAERVGVLADGAIELPAFGALLDRALARGGGASSSALARDVARARFFPRLTILGRRERLLASTNEGSTQETRWLAEVQLCFGACGTNLAIDDLDGTYAPDLLVTAGEVVELDDRGAYASSASRVLDAGAEHRLALATRLAELYSRRAVLGAQRGRTLVDEVRRALALAEIDARLDLYTDGWFAREGGQP
jgi:hypothetical protein